jgi:hypothetical protein
VAGKVRLALAYPIRLQSLEHELRIVKHARSRPDFDRPIGQQTAAAPVAVLPLGAEHDRRIDLSESEFLRQGEGAQRGGYAGRNLVV